jgi:hypothetical protein
MMWFNDSWYSLEQPSNIDQARHLVTHNDYINQSFKIISFDQAAYVVTFTPYFINYQQAKLAAESLHNKKISKKSITEFGLIDDSEIIKQWCDRYQITKEVNNFQKESNSEDYIDWFTVESYLKSSEHLDLLDQLWQDLVGKFAFVGEIIFDKTTYLSIDPYYSQIFGFEDIYTDVHYLGQYEYEYKLSLSLEKTEINYLLTALNSSQLEIRTLAYQLLKGINLDKAQQAINQGVKLNSGDKIYSVYQAGICYSDEFFHVLWDYVDYPEQLRYQLEENNIRERVEQSQRIYCYTDKPKAEAEAEALHRQLIKQTEISFEWRKENPDFDPQKWCVDNNFPYKSEWDNLSNYQIVWAIKNIIWMDDDTIHVYTIAIFAIN